MIVRRMEPSDIPEIAEMVKNVWGGADHLPTVLDKWLADSDCHPQVILIDGVISAVGNLHVIDDGRTGWMEGLRVREKMRQRGLGRVMTDAIVEIGLSVGVERLRLVTAAHSEAPQRLAKQAGLRPVSSVRAFWKDLAKSKWRHESSSIEEIGRDIFVGLVRNSAELVPQGAIYKHYDVFDAERVPLEVFDDVSCFRATKDGELASLSLGFRRLTRWGLQWCTTLYPVDEDAFLSDLSYHYYYAKAQDAQILFCIHPEEFAPSHSEVPWLRRKNHEIVLLLFERAL